MSRRSYSRIWLHFVWGTMNREHLLPTFAAVQVSSFLKRYAYEQKIFMSINYVNPDHVHALVDLPVTRTPAEIAKLLKGASSHWINHSGLIERPFAWCRGYGVFSVSYGHHERVSRYIARQAEHHRRVSFRDEYHEFVRHHGMQWHDDM